MNRLNIGPRLAALSGILACVAVAIALLGLEGMAVEKQQLETVYQDRTVALVQLASVLDDTLSILRRMDAAKQADSPDQFERTLDVVVSLDAHRGRTWQAYLRTKITPDEQQIVDRAEGHRTQLTTAHNEAIAAYRQGGRLAGQAAMATASMDTHFDAFHADLRKLIELQARVAGEQYAAAQHDYRWFLVLAIGVILTAALAGTVGSVRLIRSITAPLHEAIRAARRIADGDLNAAVPGEGIGEIGLLLRALANMQESVRAMSARIRAQVTQLEDMSNGLPVAVYQMRIFPDGKSVFTFISRRVKEIICVAPDELLDDPEARWRHVYPKDKVLALEAVSKLISRARSGEANACGQIDVRMNIGGEIRIVQGVTYATRALPDGTVTFNGFYQDITEQRRSQQLLHGLLDASPSIMFVKDAGGRYVLTNRAFEGLFRLPTGGGLGKTDFDILPPDVAERVRAVDYHVMATARVQQFEEEVPAPSGKHVFLSIKFPLIDELGKPYALCGIANDITQRRAAEVRLRESEAYNKVLFDESHVPIIVVDPDNAQYLDCNRAAIEIHGFATKDELLGKTTLDVSSPRQADGTNSSDKLEEPRMAALSEAGSVFEWRFQRPDGEIWDALVHKTTFRHGDRTLLQATLQDITLRKRAVAAIEAAKQAAEDAVRVKSDFLATMSHEIRTPLTAILGNLELLGFSPLTDIQEDRLRTITESSRTLLDIIDDILDFSKVESNQLQLEEIRFDIVETVEQSVGMFAPGARRKGLTLCLSFAPALARGYYGDPARIRQIVVNLVSNAIKFTESGSVTVDVSSVQEPPNASTSPTLTIKVRDTGIGIPAAIQRELFEPFRQADSSVTRRFGGTGLGLALCRRLVELMGGNVSVVSEVGVGSTFVVRLPVRIDPDGLVGGWRCPDDRSIALAAGSREWRSSILPHLAEWGLTIIPVSRSGELPPASIPLLCFGPAGPSPADEAQSRWIITVDDEGPRHPIATGNRVSVSCFSLDGIRHAIAGAMRGHLPARPSASVSQDLAALPDTHQPVGVLVAEDHPANRALIADQLDVLGYDAEFAENGAVALEKFATRPYDVLLTDLSMPVLDGFSLAARLREQGVSIPIVAITAHTTASRLSRCAAVGINDVLLKPFSLDDMRAMLLKHTRNRIYGPLTTTLDETAKPAKPRLPPTFFEALATASRQSLAAIQDAIAQNDATVLLRELHSIKGAFLMAQRPDVAAECARLEELARSNDLTGVMSGWPSFRRLVDEAL